MITGYPKGVSWEDLKNAMHSWGAYSDATLYSSRGRKIQVPCCPKGTPLEEVEKEPATPVQGDDLLRTHTLIFFSHSLSE